MDKYRFSGFRSLLAWRRFARSYQPGGLAEISRGGGLRACQTGTRSADLGVWVFGQIKSITRHLTMQRIWRFRQRADASKCGFWALPCARSDRLWHLLFTNGPCTDVWAESKPGCHRFQRHTLAIAYIAVGAYIHAHWFWGLHPKGEGLSYLLKLLAVLLFLGSFGYAIYKIAVT